MKKNAVAALLLILSFLLTACGSKIPEPADGYDIVLVTDSPETDGSGTQNAAEPVREASSVSADQLYAGYGFCHQHCAESGFYRFTAKNSQGVTWQVFLLDEEFTDAERYIHHAYEKVLEGSGVVHIAAGKWIYVYCSCNEWTGTRAPEGCEYSWVLDPQATAADVTVPAATPAETAGSPASTPAPTPTPSPTPTPAPTPKALVVTKHPTAETVQQGGTCWFVARADNADSITWEFLDTAGAVNTIENAKSRNPGLTVDIYDNGETIGLKNIPISMNGWMARAKFEAKTAMTSIFSNPALITVTAITDFKSAYSSVFENYLALLTGGEDKYELWTDLELSGVVLGYFLKDLDGDGTDELVVGRIGGTTGSLWDHVVYSLFTLNNGAPVKVLKSNARDRYYYTGSGFVHEGSDGADSSIIYLCRYAKGELSVVNGVYTTAEGFFNSAGEPISADQFNAAMVGLEGSVTAMMLTPIA